MYLINSKGLLLSLEWVNVNVEGSSNLNGLVECCQTWRGIGWNVTKNVSARVMDNSKWLD